MDRGRTTKQKIADCRATLYEALTEIEAQERRKEELERKNARLQVQLDTANRALEKAVRGE